jgi:hypothetical protein
MSQNTVLFMVLDMDQWQAFVSAVMNVPVPQSDNNFFAK